MKKLLLLLVTALALGLLFGCQQTYSRQVARQLQCINTNGGYICQVQYTDGTVGQCSYNWYWQVQACY